jgi:thiamine-phosphate pyrophosphorylase
MIPRLYAIIDAGILSARGISPETFARELREAGVELIQYRDKTGQPQQILEAAARIRAALAGSSCRLILNDRADLAVLAKADGVHVGQDDLSPADVRSVVGPDRLIGLSTHNDEQVRNAEQTAEQSAADYIAIGPVFATGTKLNPDPVIGLEGVRRARALTSKPLVAIGGITRSNARSVIDGGADSVAIVSGLLIPGETVAKVARDILDILR